MNTREISKTPTVPHLDKNLQTLLTQLCFGQQQPFNNVDVIFVYGTPFFIEQTALSVTELLEKNVTNNVLITGGIVPHGKPLETQRSEAELIYEQIPKKFDTVKFHIETQSQNTLENVTQGLALLDLNPNPSVCFIFPAHGTMRGYLTLRKFLPDATVYPHSYDAQYPDEASAITQHNWFMTDNGKQRVWGEYLRIKQYGQRGDIAYAEVEALVTSIDQMLHSNIG